jgi:hypothetical protein
VIAWAFELTPQGLKRTKDQRHYCRGDLAICASAQYVLAALAGIQAGYSAVQFQF